MVNVLSMSQSSAYTSIGRIDAFLRWPYKCGWLAFPKTCLHFKNCRMTLEPSCLRKCSLQCIVSTHCCHPKRL